MEDASMAKSVSLDSSAPIGARRTFTLAQRETIAGTLFALPAILGFLIFSLGPMIASVVISFTDWSLTKSPTWLGTDNYQRMFSDPKVMQSLMTTLKFGLMSVPLGLLISLSIALLLNQKIVGRRLFLTLFYFPSILPMAAVLITFLWVLQPDFGLLNYLLSRIGVQGQNWMGNKDTVLPSLVMLSAWGAGGGSVIFLAALQGIPSDYYEAAGLDGAGNWGRFRFITLPLISPVIFFQLVLGMIGALQVFTQAYMIRGGPNDAALFFNYYLYQNAFNSGRMGYASALAWLLFAITMILTVAAFRSSALWVFYEDQSRK